MYVPKVKSLSSKTPDKMEEIMEQMVEQWILMVIESKKVTWKNIHYNIFDLLL